MADEFIRFAENLFKSGKERRKREAPAKLRELEGLWLDVSEDEWSEDLQATYDKCISFISAILQEIASEEAAAAASSKNSNEDPKNPSSGKNISLSNLHSQSVEMSLDFDIKTAGSMIPDFDGNTKQLVDFLDCAKLYNEMLKGTSHAIFLKFLLKVKLKGKAKLAISDTIENFADFEKAMRVRFKPKTTLTRVQHELSSLTQGSKSVSEFATKIEDLVSKLTELQIAEKGDGAREIIKSLNDTLALNVLKMGSTDGVKKVLLAAQVKDFSSGVSLAVEAETSLPVFSEPAAQVSTVRRGKFSSHRGSYHHTSAPRSENRGRGKTYYNKNHDRGGHYQNDKNWGQQGGSKNQQESYNNKNQQKSNGRGYSHAKGQKDYKNQQRSWKGARSQPGNGGAAVDSTKYVGVAALDVFP